MSDKKNIDRFFREKFKDFDPAPGSHVWASIAARLEKEKKDKRVFPIIIRYCGIAASMALMVGLGYYLRGLETPVDKTIAQHTMPNTIDKTNPSATDYTQLSVTQEREKNNNRNLYNKREVKNTLTSKEVAQNPDKNSVLLNTHEEGANANQENIQNHETPQSPFNQNDGIVANIVANEDSNKKSLLEAIRDNYTEENEASSLKGGKWSVGSAVAPVYFNSLARGSSIDPRFTDNSKSGNVNMSYGLTVAYRVNKRFSVRSGVSKVNYGYSTHGIAFTPALQENGISSIAYRDDKPTIVITDSNINNPDSELKSNSATSYNGDMVQELGYVEVPVELKYRLVDKKIGFTLVGGMSSLFLTDNSITLQTDALTAQIGSARNVNNVNFSANVGVGLDYKVSDRILLNMEPMFKYQLQTFSGQSDFKPYSLGIYTGLSFKF